MSGAMAMGHGLGYSPVTPCLSLAGSASSREVRCLLIEGIWRSPYASATCSSPASSPAFSGDYSVLIISYLKLRDLCAWKLDRAYGLLIPCE